MTQDYQQLRYRFNLIRNAALVKTKCCQAPFKGLIAFYRKIIYCSMKYISNLARPHVCIYEPNLCQYCLALMYVHCTLYTVRCTLYTVQCTHDIPVLQEKSNRWHRRPARAGWRKHHSVDPCSNNHKIAKQSQNNNYILYHRQQLEIINNVNKAF